MVHFPFVFLDRCKAPEKCAISILNAINTVHSALSPQANS